MLTRLWAWWLKAWSLEPAGYTVQSGTSTDYLHTRAIERVDTSGEKVVVYYDDGTSEEIE